MPGTASVPEEQTQGSQDNQNERPVGQAPAAGWTVACFPIGLTVCSYFLMMGVTIVTGTLRGTQVTHISFVSEAKGPKIWVTPALVLLTSVSPPVRWAADLI